MSNEIEDEIERELEKMGVDLPIRFGFHSERIVNFIKRPKVPCSFRDQKFKLELLFRPPSLDSKQQPLAWRPK